MRETSKMYSARLLRGDFNRYLCGTGIDIGAGDDGLSMPPGDFGTVVYWDKKNGDAQYMSAVPDEMFDFVYSSHCLEHLADVRIALQNWARILKPGGHLYVVTPDWQLYEGGIWPSRWNAEHKWAFTLQHALYDPHVLYWPDLARWVEVTEMVSLCELRLEDYGYDYTLSSDIDQTYVKDACAQICYIGRKLK